MNLQEIWLPILDFSDYEISNMGNIRSIDRYITLKNGSRRFCKGQVLVQSINTYGYYEITLHKESIQKTHRVHRLVAQYFISCFDSSLQVNHINGIKTDNRLYNLEMVTCQRNIQHAYELGLSVGRKKEKLSQYTINNVFVCGFESIKDASIKTGIPSSNICSCLSGRLKSAGNFIWKRIIK